MFNIKFEAMKRKIFVTVLLLFTMSAMGQARLKGFSETITLGSKIYLVADEGNNETTCLDYRLIAETNYFSTMFGKFPAFGVIDGNNQIIVPCIYAGITFETSRGCILLFHTNKQLFNGKYGMVDFDGHEILPISIPMKVFNMSEPDKKVWKHYDKLPLEVKERCVQLYNQKRSLYAYKNGSIKGSSQSTASPVVVAQNTPSPMPTPTTSTPQKSIPKSDVDINIPVTGNKASDTFVLIIANEEYMFVDNVDFALNDGKTFKEYCLKTLGVPERQIWHYENASGGVIAGAVDKMVQAMNIFNSARAIIYYCGHGIPDEQTGDAYIIPTDGKGTNTATCYSLNNLYTSLANSKATNVTYFMDACFSGANKQGSMLVAARGVAREAKKEVLSGSTVVFSAASGDETAMVYKDKGHGLFTYFLLKKLQESNGNVSYNELAQYLTENVKRESFLTNEKLQVPTVLVSDSIKHDWESFSLK